MTLEDAISKYGNIPLRFSSYYKFSFAFKWEDDNVIVSASYWWDSDSVYRYTVTRDWVEKLNESFSHIYIKGKASGEVIFDYYSEY